MIYVITGRRELGKTTLARYLAAKRTPQLVIDPRTQWPELDGTVTVEAVDWRALAWLEEGRSVIVQPRDLDESITVAADVAEAYVQVDRERPLSLVLDEAKLYDTRAFGWLMRCSNRRTVNVILTAHRPQDIPTDVRAILDTWCVFRTTQQHDLAALGERTSERFAAMASQLPAHHFVAWDDAAVDHAITLHARPELWKEPDVTPLVGEPAIAQHERKRLF